MKKKLLMILTVITCVLAGCSANQAGNAGTPQSVNEDQAAVADTGVGTDDNEVEDDIQDPGQNVETEDTEDEEVSEANDREASKFEQVEYNEPDITDVSDTEKTIYFYRGELKIFGKLHLPEGEGPFPAMILLPGFRAPYTTIEDVAKTLTDNGIASVTFNPIGAVDSSKSDGLIGDMSVITEAMDVQTVLKSISVMPKIDSSNIFLWGHSFGGLVMTYATTQMPNEIRGVVAVEPSYQMPDEYRELYPEGTEIPDAIYQPLLCGGMFVKDIISINLYDLMPEYPNNVLIVAGTVAPSIGAEAPELLEQAVDSFPSARILSVEKADHGFMGEVRTQMAEETVQFVKDNMK